MDQALKSSQRGRASCSFCWQTRFTSPNRKTEKKSRSCNYAKGLVQIGSNTFILYLLIRIFMGKIFLVQQLLKKYFGKSNCLEESSRILWYCPNLFVFWPVKFFLKNYPNILTTVQAKRLYSSFLKLRTSAFFLSYNRMIVHRKFQLSTYSHSSFNQSQLSTAVKTTAEPCEPITAVIPPIYLHLIFAIL